MDLWQFAKLMKEFDVLHEQVNGKPYWYRFMGSPYNAFCAECRSISIMAHNRGTRVSPLVILQVLAKFNVQVEEFLRALDGKPMELPPADTDEGKKGNGKKPH